MVLDRQGVKPGVGVLNSLNSRSEMILHYGNQVSRMFLREEVFDRKKHRQFFECLGESLSGPIGIFSSTRFPFCFIIDLADARELRILLGTGTAAVVVVGGEKVSVSPVLQVGVVAPSCNENSPRPLFVHLLPRKIQNLGPRKKARPSLPVSSTQHVETSIYRVTISSHTRTPYNHVVRR